MIAKFSCADDNDVTIAGHPSEYLKGYELTKTLKGHGLDVIEVEGEDIDALWGAVSKIVSHNGPAAGNHLQLILRIFLISLYFSRLQAIDGSRCC